MESETGDKLEIGDDIGGIDLCIAIHDYMSKRDAMYCIRFDNVSTCNSFPIPNSLKCLINGSHFDWN